MLSKTGATVVTVVYVIACVSLVAAKVAPVFDNIMSSSRERFKDAQSRIATGTLG